MSLYEETACCKSQKRFLETCIDGNACKETSADERWVGILAVLTSSVVIFCRRGFNFRLVLVYDILLLFISYFFLCRYFEKHQTHPYQVNKKFYHNFSERGYIFLSSVFPLTNKLKIVNINLQFMCLQHQGYWKSNWIWQVLVTYMTYTHS